MKQYCERCGFIDEGTYLRPSVQYAEIKHGRSQIEMGALCDGCVKKLSKMMTKFLANEDIACEAEFKKEHPQ